MSVLHALGRTLVLLAGMTLALTACVKAAGEADAITITTPAIAGADAPPPGNDRFPPDVYRPAGYTVRSVTDAERVLTISGDAPDSTSELFAQARATMPMQGWEETHVEQSAGTRMLAFEKSGYEAQLTFQPNGNATRFEVQLQRP